MRATLPLSLSDHVVLVGTGEAAMSALWRLCAAGARVRWYADSADIGEEAVLAHALGGGRVELSFDDPSAAPLDGTTSIVIADGENRHARLSERARARGVMVQFVGDEGLAGPVAAGLLQPLPAGTARPA